MPSDKILSRYPSVVFNENHRYIPSLDIVYQIASETIEYDKDYYNHYVNLNTHPFAREINQGRVQLIEKYCKCILDIGIGSGKFIESLNIPAYGYDINPFGVQWLKEKGIYIDPYTSIPDNIDGITMWDVLEHMISPSKFLKLIEDQIVLISIPIFENILKLRQSKHFKYREHLVYFSTKGLISYFNDCGFELLEINDQETQIGREDILSFVFKRRNNKIGFAT